MLHVVVCVKAVCIVVVVVVAKRDYNGPQTLRSNTVRILNCYLHS